MKKIFIAMVLLTAAGMSACKKEEMAKPVKVSVKSIGDIKDHTGWDNSDSTADNNGGH